MKTAIVHDWLTGMRGGEKCLEVMCELYPDATLYTLLHRRGHLSPTIENMRIHTSWIQKLPFREHYYRHLLPLYPGAVESFDLSGFDLVISSSHCVAKGAVAPKGAPHICYCYTPMRYAWDQYEQYFGPDRLRWWNRWIIPPLIGRLRNWDGATAHRVDAFAAISHFVAKRIKQYYNRDAEIIYPPVDLEHYTQVLSPPGDYYLMVNALAPYKRVDVAIEAFNTMNRELRIVGTGQDEARLRELAGDNIRFLGWLPQESLAEVYAGCRALIFPVEEDFGITPLEAQACGRPVIAYGRGGVLETVRPHPGFPPGDGIWSDQKNDPTGVFFTSRTPEAIASAVDFFEKHQQDFTPRRISESVRKFSRDRFKKELASFAERAVNSFGKGEPLEKNGKTV